MAFVWHVPYDTYMERPYNKAEGKGIIIIECFIEMNVKWTNEW